VAREKERHDRPILAIETVKLLKTNGRQKNEPAHRAKQTAGQAIQTRFEATRFCLSEESKWPPTTSKSKGAAIEAVQEIAYNREVRAFRKIRRAKR
jgi:hypothetical protein